MNRDIYEIICKCKCVVFDLDDTLLYTYKNAFLKTNLVAQELNLNPISMEIFLKNYGNMSFFECLRDWFGEINVIKFKKLYGELNSIVSYKPILDFSILQGQIKKLGKKVAIITNSSLNVSLMKKLSSINCDYNMLDYIYTRDNNVKPKPAKEAFQKILEDSNLQADDIVYIGDSEGDYISCKLAGIKFIATKTGTYEWSENNRVPNIKSVDALVTMIG